MKRKLSYLSTFAALGLILATGQALAQTADSQAAGDGTGATAASEGAFQALSPGGRKIARALFDAQQPPPANGEGANGAGTTEPAARLSLDDIAAAKASGAGWGRVFKEMRAEGLIAEKNLGQVVSGANHRSRLGGGDGSNDTVTDTGTDTGTGTGDAATGTTVAATSATTAARSASPSGRHAKPVTVTLANGATVVVGGRGRGHGNALRGDAMADATGPKAGTARSHDGGFGAAGGHGNKSSVAASAAGRSFGALRGNAAPAGSSAAGVTAAGSGVTAASGQAKGVVKGRKH